MTPPFDGARFAKICEMLRSDNPNERAIAAERASSYLADAGLSWTVLVSQACAAPANRTPPPVDSQPVRRERRYSINQRGQDVQDVVAILTRNITKLSPWEQQFLRTIEPHLNAGRKRSLNLSITHKSLQPGLNTATRV